jgi:site-specific recombinase XerD
MKTAKPNTLARIVLKFFKEYLPRRGMTTHTRHSYRDALELFFQFVAARGGCEIETLKIEHVTAAEVEEFLADLELVRGNGISTRNVRLAALRTFVRFVAAEAPEYAIELQRISAIPFKRASQRVANKYLPRR